MLFLKHSSVFRIICPLVCCGTCEVWHGQTDVISWKVMYFTYLKTEAEISPPASQILQEDNKISLGL